MDITIVTTAQSDDAGRALLEAFGFPFKREAEIATVTKKRRGPTVRGGKGAPRGAKAAGPAKGAKKK